MASKDFDFGADLPDFEDDLQVEQPSKAVESELAQEALANSSMTKPQGPLPAVQPTPRQRPVASVAKPQTPVIPQVAATPQVPSNSGDLAADSQEQEVDKPNSIKRRQLMFAVPGWLISLAVHTALLLAMAAYTIEPIKDALTKLVIDSGPSEESSGIESFDVVSEDMSSALDAQTELTQQPITEVTQVTEMAVEVPVAQVEVGNLAQVSIESLSSQLVPSNVLAATSNQLTQGMSARSGDTKRELLKKFGGGDDTEKAVAMGLQWLKQHQLPDGSWTYDHSASCQGQCKDSGSFPDARNSATGLALMCYLGAGQTHLEGEYKETVFKGLTFLLNSMQYDKFGDVALGTWYADPAPKALGRNPNTHNRIYGHGIATIAICEAYGMTKDPKLAEAAQLGINFIVAAQDPRGGGWNYELRSAGDTSIVGWQMMALKSAWMSNIPFPQETVRKASFFLDSVQTDNGSAYHYRRPGDRSADRTSLNALTSCGILCRMYMGMPKDHPSIKIAADRILADGPSKADSYVNYYATQVMKQVGGEHWKKWNEQMKTYLIGSQINTGHSMGSWNPGTTYGDNSGGRLYRTAMSIMVLEVYYRYLPIYAEQAEEDTFKL